MEQREYQRVYVIDYKNLTEENFRNNPENMIRAEPFFDYDTEDVWKRDHGLMFDTVDEAIEAAKSEYCTLLLKCSTRPYDGHRENYSIFYDNELKSLCICKDEMPAHSEFFETEEDARRFLDQLGIEEYARYVLQLKNVPLNIEIQL